MSAHASPPPPTPSPRSSVDSVLAAQRPVPDPSTAVPAQPHHVDAAWSRWRAAAPAPLQLPKSLAQEEAVPLSKWSDLAAPKRSAMPRENLPIVANVLPSDNKDTRTPPTSESLFVACATLLLLAPIPTRADQAQVRAVPSPQYAPLPTAAVA